MARFNHSRFQAPTQSHKLQGKWRRQKTLAHFATAAVLIYAADTSAETLRLGDDTSASKDTVTIGDKSSTKGGNSVALGIGAKSGTDKTIETTAIGSFSSAFGEGSTALGGQSNANGDFTAAVGGHAKAFGTGSIAAGYRATAGTDENANATAVGSRAEATGARSTALGTSAQARESSSVAIGDTADATRQDSLAIGTRAKASGSSTVALGKSALADGDQAIAVGVNAKAGDSGVSDTIAVGASAQATGNRATAIGSQAKATGSGSWAAGYLSIASGQSSAAIGASSEASGKQSIAIGTSSKATAENSVALGSGSKATRANTVDIGTRTLTSIHAGTEDGDAINVKQLEGVTAALGGSSTVDANGAIVAPSYLVGGVTHSTVGGALTNLDTRVSDNTSDIEKINESLTSSSGSVLGVSYDSAEKDVVTFGGASGTRLTNIAAGQLAPGSTDAINGAQIFDLTSRFNAKIDGLDVRVTSLESNEGTGGGTNTGGRGDGGGGGGGSESGSGSESESESGGSSGIGHTSHSSVVDGPNGATSIGVGSELPTDHALSVGATGSERRIVHVGAGQVGTDAVNLDQLNAARNSAVGESQSYTDLRFGQTRSRIDEVGRTAYSGVAMAMAMPNIAPTKAGSTVVAAGSAGFQGYAALGLGVTYRSPNGQMLLNGAFAYSDSGGAAARVQVGYEF
ncbi:YadA-like family protein [Pararobbsia alpina]|uniref:Uncharacterized protein n=1 Tax=Pararobbsia alpina TaxID=621374 RepID=A0A6S7C146_9BURK|nr:YadA-like family protein [Pararobbsia alpina]CAB3778773.1 hypothetical protein LMG28138_00588 [Pararobbsia alpina]